MAPTNNNCLFLHTLCRHVIFVDSRVEVAYASGLVALGRVPDSTFKNRHI